MTAVLLWFLSFATGVWGVPRFAPTSLSLRLPLAPSPLPAPALSTSRISHLNHAYTPAPRPATARAVQIQKRAGTISVNIPLADQHPPVVRIGSPFNWSISRDTFSTKDLDDGATTTYEAADLPSWLTFDSTTMSFSGTPPNQLDSERNVKVQFTLTARTSSSPSSKASTKATLRVLPSSSNSTSPVVKVPLAEQFKVGDPPIWSLFPISPGSALYNTESHIPALRIPPPWSFSVGFQPDTFVDSTGSDDGIGYDVLQADGTPCPRWMVFNKRDITLDGVVPRSYLRSGKSGGGSKDGNEEEEAEEDATKVLDRVKLMLVATDREGNEGREYFDIVVAAHDLSVLTDGAGGESNGGDGGTGDGPPTLHVNLTRGTQFDVRLSPFNAFRGLAMDGKQIQRENITSVTLDTSNFPWLNFDPGTFWLSGTVPDTGAAVDLANDDEGGDGERRTLMPIIPMSVESTFNQTLNTNLTLNIIPSFFNNKSATIEIEDDGNVNVDLSSYLSNALPNPDSSISVVNFTCKSSSKSDNSSLKFDPNSGRLTGTLSDSCKPSNGESTLATISVLSLVTFSISKLALTITSKNNAVSPHGGGSLSTNSHARLILALAITFGILGGGALLAIGLACFRKWARVPDSAVLDENGDAWSDREKQWYGIYDNAALSAAGVALGRSGSGSLEGEMGSEGGGGGDAGAGYGYGYGYGWSDGRYGEEKLGGSRGGPDLVVRPNSYLENPPVPASGIAAALGLGLHRVHERSESQAGAFESPARGRMRKGEFLSKVRQTVRKVSDKYNQSSLKRQNLGTIHRVQLNGGNRPVIGKPILVTSNNPASESTTRQGPSILSMAGEEGGELPLECPFEGPGVSGSNPGSTLMTNSPSTSTDDRSIPRRRADFALPANLKAPPQVHFKGQQQLGPSNNPFINPSGFSPQAVSGAKKDSLESMSSLAMKAHAEEAVIQTASRATSIRSGISHHSFTSDLGNGLQSGKLYINHKNSLLLQPITPSGKDRGGDIIAQVAGTGGGVATPNNPNQRPKLVPFTSASRVPVPTLSPTAVPSTVQIIGVGGGGGGVGAATMTPTPANRGTSKATGHLKKSESGGSGDDLTMGLHYVQTLGLQSGSGIADLLQDHGPSIPRSGSGSRVQGQGQARGHGNSGKGHGGQQTVDSLASTHIRSSFSSLESSHGASLSLAGLSDRGGGGGGGGGVGGGIMTNNTIAPRPIRMIVRTGEKFKFRVPIVNRRPQGQGQQVKDMYEVRLISGRSLPGFIQVDMNTNANANTGRGRPGGGGGGVGLELSGVPAPADLGVLEIGVYLKDGSGAGAGNGTGTGAAGAGAGGGGAQACVAQVVLEVVGRS